MSKKILWIDGSMRENSRTRILARTVIEHLDGEVNVLRVDDEKIPPLSAKTLEKRDALLKANHYDDPMLKYAKQFAEADEIVLSAPYWDLSFPAAVRAYIEAITVCGVTFKYSETGIPEGLCRAKVLYYVITSGGTIGEMNFGEKYIRNIARKLYGIPQIHCFTAENLDLYDSDPETIIKAAKDEINAFFRG